MLFEKQKIQQCFNKAAATYDQAATLQHDTGKQLLNHLEQLSGMHELILDVGAGTGYCTHLLAKRYPAATIIGIDFAQKMLETAQKNALPSEQYIYADFDNLPLQKNSIDLIYANFAWQWSLDLKLTLEAAKLVLKKNGYIIFSSLGPQTLCELRAAFASIDQHQHLNEFLSIDEVKQNLLTCDFKILDLKQELQTLSFNDIFELMRNLKKVGANYVFNKDIEHLSTRHYFERLAQAYECFKIDDKLPASYEIIYGLVQK
jgi:malonyl-CoA O-methyltransferase